MVNRIVKLNRQQISQIATDQQQVKWFEAIQNSVSDLPDVEAEIARLELAFELALVSADGAQITAQQALLALSDAIRAALIQDVYQPSNSGQIYPDVYQPPIAQDKQVFTLAAPFSSVSVTPANVTGWSVNVYAGAVYRMTVIGAYQTGVITTGGVLGVNATGAAGTIVGAFNGSVQQARGTNNQTQPLYAVSGAGSSMTTSAVDPINTPHFFNLDSVFTCTTSGTMDIQWATEVAASAAQLNAGSVFIFERLV